MSVHANPEELQVLEHKERILSERLKLNLADQNELRQREGELRCEMQRIENQKFTCLKKS